MKTLAVLFAATVATCSSVGGEIPWTHSADEVEDATSTHYYLYQSNGESVIRVRWVWNGGAQNAPAVTEYLLGPDVIMIRRFVGKRESIAALIRGADGGMELEDQYSISAKDASQMLISPEPDKTLTEKQRLDLKNLIDLLARERKPRPGQNKKTRALSPSVATPMIKRMKRASED